MAAGESSYILVVDDETAVRDFLVRCLENGGYACKQAGGAAEALEVMITSPAALVLCDIRMPGHDGLWLTQRVRAHWPEASVVMVTALDDVQTVQEAREMGAVDYVSKPISPDQLLQVVRRAMALPKNGGLPSEGAESAPPEPQPPADKMEAEYMLEHPVKCPACGERLTAVKAIRMLRTQVNFTSTLPRRGRLIACPYCVAIIPAELTNF